MLWLRLSPLLCLFAAWTIFACNGPNLPTPQACKTDGDCSAGQRCSDAARICVSSGRETSAEPLTEVSLEGSSEPSKEAEPPKETDERRKEQTPEDASTERLPDDEPLPEKECATGDKRPCQSTFPNCTEGSQTCSDAGRWGTCFPTVETEVCNGKDDDCNGRVDEFFADQGKDCAIPGIFGVCNEGVLTCDKGKEVCLPKKSPGAEVCDGLDNDCDGHTDNQETGKPAPLTRPCFKGRGGCLQKPDGTFECQGICKAGLQTCDKGEWKDECLQQIPPTSEICDGLDNDCDGQTDENFPQKGQACTQGIGNCLTTGLYICAADKQGVSCNANPPPPGVEACDGRDGDCDGKTDEGCACQSGTTRSCGSSIGACIPGTQPCAGGQWGPCAGAMGPTPEICDGEDNDCDGKTDEAFQDQGVPCQIGGQHGVCLVGVQTCQAGRLVCVGPTPTAEICDNKDNDCDGRTDEALSRSCYTDTDGCLSTPQGTYTCQGNCKSGSQTCAAGQWGSCLGQSLPSSESCDGKDEDCDGKVDEGITCLCIPTTTRPCGSDVGECKAGTQTCGLGVWGPCKGELPATPEICDNKDNDCDGKVDEGTSSGLACPLPQFPTLKGVEYCCAGQIRCLPASIPDPCACAQLCLVSVLVAGNSTCYVGCPSGGTCVGKLPLPCGQSASICSYCNAISPKGGTFSCRGNVCIE